MKSDAGRARSARPVATAHGALCAVDCFECRLGVDVRVTWKHEADLGATDQSIGTHCGPQPRYHGIEKLVGRRSCLVTPQGIRHLEARYRARWFAEEGAQRTPLSTRQTIREVGPCNPDEQLSTELDPRLRQGFRKVMACARLHNAPVDRKEKAMSKLINCECGAVVRGTTDDELVKAAEAHVQENHPELVGKLSREDILAMAEEA